MQTFKVKRFSKWARIEKITDKVLMEAAKEIQQGLVDASMGGYVFKKRIPIDGRGKRGGARVILAYKADERLFFMYGFSKSEKEDISQSEKESLKEFAHEMIGLSKAKIDTLISNKVLEEIKETS